MTNPRTPPDPPGIVIETVPFIVVTEAEVQNIVSMYLAGWTVAGLAEGRERPAQEIRWILLSKGVRLRLADLTK